jgi:hypothetical protein
MPKYPPHPSRPPEGANLFNPQETSPRRFSLTECFVARMGMTHFIWFSQAPARAHKSFRLSSL